MNEKLKPCPFCGGEATFSTFLTTTNTLPHFTAGVLFEIKCTQCKMKLPKSYRCEMYIGQDGDIQTEKDERAQAVVDWNRRANDGETD